MCCAQPSSLTSSHPILLVLAKDAVTCPCQRLLCTLSTLRHPHTSPYEGDDKAASALLLRREAAAPEDGEVPDVYSASPEE